VLVCVFIQMEVGCPLQFAWSESESSSSVSDSDDEYDDRPLPPVPEYDEVSWWDSPDFSVDFRPIQFMTLTSRTV
jgi:hypothetical protein